MATRLFVGNLPENTQEDDLLSAFSSFGEIKNLDLKSKSAVDSESKKFAFVTLSGSNFNIESCIKHFSTDDFNGKRLYVTRARESFLERLQRERAAAQQKVTENSPQECPKKNPVIRLGDKLNPRKRKLDNDPIFHQRNPEPVELIEKTTQVTINGFHTKDKAIILNGDQKRQDSDKKRMEAMKKKRQEFKNKQMIVKTGLTSVDVIKPKKVKFSDNEDDTPQLAKNHMKDKPEYGKKKLFDDNDAASDDEPNFEIKKQFEGTKGQKVLDLQSRYKSDKRFVLDERFIDDEKEQEKIEDEDKVEVNQENEKAKQLNILQDVLGVVIKRKVPDDERDKKNKQKIGMLRFDPTQPEHAKFLAPIEEIKYTKKTKKKKDKHAEEPLEQEPQPEQPRPEVSKEQFYKISDTLKEAIAQPTSFSLRSLFGNKEIAEEEPKNENYVSLETQKKKKVKNPLDPGDKNPFVYDSSDSETEEPISKTTTESTLGLTENKAVWKESLFFGESDQRLKEGLAFFNNANDAEPHKERRELKSLMKKRIYNKERKNQMFQKKIGGRKKTMKKSFRKKS